MASEQSSIMVRVGADIEPLKKGFKTASQKVGDFKTGVMDATKQVAKIAAGAAAAATGLVAMASASAQNAREIKNLARVAGTGATEFQKLAFGAQTVGVEQDKLANILKDTQDKVGDFLATGAGPMADFFEQIAPKVGVTAEQFRRLNGRDALQLYVDSLEKANVSQNEMTFYMEAIASDAALLQPLLANNGEAFQMLGKKAERTGAVLSELDIQKLDQMQVSLDLARQNAEATANEFSAKLAPVIEDLTEKFLGANNQINDIGTVSDNVFHFMVKAIGLAGDAIRGVQVVVKGLELAFFGLKKVALLVAEAITGFFDDITMTVGATINGMIRAVNKIPKIHIDEIVVGESAATQKIREWSAGTSDQIAQTQGELHSLLMEELPSTAWENYVAEVTAASDQAAQAVVDAQTKVQTAAPVEGEEAHEVAAVKDNTGQMLHAYKVYYNARNAAKKQADAAQESLDQKHRAQAVSGLSGMFGNLSSLMNTENRKMFEIGKKAAQAQTVVDTYAAAQSAYKSLAGIPIIGPGLGAAAAGAAIVSGMARLSAISATSFGSSSAAGGAAAGGGGGAPAAVTGGAAAEQGTAAGGAQSTMFVEGLTADSLIRGDNVRVIAEELLEYQRDGGQVVLV